MRELNADVVVIGAGPAGLAVASRLVAAGRRVLVLESGGMEPALDPDAARATVRGPLPYFDMVECRPRGLGGSTGLWGGWCDTLDAGDFDGWCLSRSDLRPYYRAACAFCGIPDEITFRDWRRADDARAAASPFEARGFPVAAAGHLGRRHAGLFAPGGADLRLGATVTRIVTAPGGTAVDHVVVGGDVAVRGGAFVLAAGGIETPRLLLASAAPDWPRGLGNAHDMVGRCFMEHPHVDAMRLRASAELLDVEFFLERETAGQAADGTPASGAGTLVLGAEACRAAGIGRLRLFVEPAGGHTGHPVPRLWRGRPPRLSGRAPADGELAVITVSEQAPNPGSRVVLGDAGDRHGVPLPVLHLELTEADHRTIFVGVELARGLLESLGARDVRRRLRRRTWPRDTLGGPHHLGTARMSADPAHGVVDGDCRVHGVDNLYVAGGAVFPTCGCAPPTLTIVALALRLGDHLARAGVAA